MKNYFTYVLYSEKFDKIYVGQTSELEIRLAQHNEGKVSSTKRYKPWIYLFIEEFDSRSESMKKKRELKSHKGRDFIRELVRVRQLPD